ncbi:hypothetical protein M3650_21410 [Paenibacillus sp. MER TA 81-3]|nr:hypothetical protein [Paenibacillus sp. MER TA 81-3]MCM3341118.1 hypothetical protein [Paenibacillus sp. MER TA 81-3]
MEFHELQGERIKLIPLEFDHIPNLYEYSKHPEIWTHYPAKIRTLEDS